MPAAKKQAAPKITPTLRDAFARWMKGELRPALIKSLNLKMSIGELGKSFRAMNPDKKWQELKAMRTKPSVRKQPKSAKKVKAASPAAKEEHTSRRKAA